MGILEAKEEDMGGDFNEIMGPVDKNGRNKRRENSFNPFRTFIRDMEMGIVSDRGRRWTWANNRHGEGFIEGRLDMFFGSAEWMLDFDKAEVLHILKQASDHAMLFLDFKPQQPRGKSRFIFDGRWSCRQDV